MLEDLSQHILDIAENSVNAGATDVLVELREERSNDLLFFIVDDNGRGMSPDFLNRVTDPFTTTRTTRRVGMGLPFLKQSAELCGGEMSIRSTVGVGTRLEVTFRLSSVDLPPLGDIPATVMALFMGHPDIHWIYRHVTDQGSFEVVLDEIVSVLGDASLLRLPETAQWLRAHVRENLEEIGWGGLGM